MPQAHGNEMTRARVDACERSPGPSGLARLGKRCWPGVPPGSMSGPPQHATWSPGVMTAGQDVASQIRPCRRRRSDPGLAAAARAISAAFCPLVSRSSAPDRRPVECLVEAGICDVGMCRSVAAAVRIAWGTRTSLVRWCCFESISRWPRQPGQGERRMGTTGEVYEGVDGGDTMPDTGGRRRHP